MQQKPLTSNSREPAALDKQAEVHEKSDTGRRPLADITAMFSQQFGNGPTEPLAPQLPTFQTSVQQHTLSHQQKCVADGNLVDVTAPLYQTAARNTLRKMR
eukprot:CAMPEP_0202891406 /NCGR_PEP_ID=MMETSP1392-20130828/1474_1 /ASSEMBLY_ACC=CAM_ASM_000868 /TAXON_ID=225041 /ORGANISM="Chlamydomonas chlamydogama, Strain SAG 11-48b" /LENGTH=100 /DNA_ID=CAMNT_0049575145 /DNA_START=157 /DNA_END=459 /DNA_ORIENTATION=-